MESILFKLVYKTATLRFEKSQRIDALKCLRVYSIYNHYLHKLFGVQFRFQKWYMEEHTPPKITNEQQTHWIGQKRKKANKIIIMTYGNANMFISNLYSFACSVSPSQRETYCVDFLFYQKFEKLFLCAAAAVVVVAAFCVSFFLLFSRMLLPKIVDITVVILVCYTFWKLKQYFEYRNCAAVCRLLYSGMCVYACALFTIPFHQSAESDRVAFGQKRKFCISLIIYVLDGIRA